MGSYSDWPLLKETCDTLARFAVPVEARVLSAHRVPDDAASFSRTAEERGLKVIIAAAGVAAHLAGCMAANSTLPVIGIPVAGGDLNGLDSLHSTVQMPGGIPVATVAIGKAGAINAALLAVQILALNDPQLRQQLYDHKAALRKKTLETDAQLQQQLGRGK